MTLPKPLVLVEEAVELDEHQVGLVTQPRHARRHLRRLTVIKAGGASRLPQTPSATMLLYHVARGSWLDPLQSWYHARRMAPLARTMSYPSAL